MTCTGTALTFTFTFFQHAGVVMAVFLQVLLPKLIYVFLYQMCGKCSSCHILHNCHSNHTVDVKSKFDSITSLSVGYLKKNVTILR